MGAPEVRGIAAPGWPTRLEAFARRLLARRGRDGLVLLALVAVALAWAGPAWKHGWSFGSYDLVLHFGLGQGLFGAVHNAVNGDNARQGAVWMQLDWQAVHQGRLPLWDPSIVLGLPLAPNLQSAPASLPTLVGYLVPLRYAYGAAVLAKLVVGGLGCYVAARVLGVSRSGALLAGVVGEIAGPMGAWSGWPQAGVAEWTGWLVACVVLVASAPRWRRVAGLAVVVGFACAGGFPEVVVILAIALVLIGILLLLPPGGGTGWGGFVPEGSRWRRAAGLCSGTVLGGLLAAPLWLPALPVLARSVSKGRAAPVLGTSRELWLFLDPSYWGLPTSGSVWFGPLNYYETAAFVGPAVLGLVVVALLRRSRDVRVVGLVLASVVLLVLALGPASVVSLEHDLPDLGSVAFGRSLLVIGDLLGIVAAVGLDEVRRRGTRALGAAWAGLLAVAVPLALLLANALPAGSLPAAERAVRLHGAALAGAGLGALALLVVGRTLLPLLAGAWGRAREGAGRSEWLLTALALLLVLVEAGTLVLATGKIPSWTSRYLPTNRAIEAAVADTHGGLVGLGGEHTGGTAVSLGILANLNAAYGLRELAGYDGVMPRALEEAWARSAPAPDLAAAEVAGDVTSFVPPITTLTEARALGVEYLLEPAQAPIRLVDGASAGVRRALRAAGAGSPPSVATGLLDDLEWLTEEPTLLHDYPVARPGSLAAYLGALAGPGVSPPEPAELGPLAAKVVVPLLAKDPRLVRSLLALFTEAPPSGSAKVATIGPEVLYRFPALSGATFAAAGGGRVLSPLRYSGNDSATVEVAASRPGWLRLGIDAEPGWTATVGGRVVPLATAEGGAVLQVEVPAGRSTVDLVYWPKYLTLGSWLALLALLVLLGGGLGPALVRRWRR